jgi:DNA polymerase (family 10)
MVGKKKYKKKKEQYLSSDIKPIVNYITNKINNLIVVGSLRRNSKYANDIDFISLQTLDLIFNNLIDIKDKFVSFPKKVLNTRKKLSLKYKYNGKNVQIDFFYVQKQELPFALLHFTGNYIFNIVMRLVAKEKGYKLNQYGLFPIKENSIFDKQLINDIKSERDIFNFLNFVWKEPFERDIGEEDHIHWKKIQKGEKINKLVKINKTN